MSRYNGAPRMPLAPGTKLGSYEVQEPLGAGGMDEVYRVRDTRLDRTVLIKISPQLVVMCRTRIIEIDDPRPANQGLCDTCGR
jgi:hypothetical protein